MMPTKINLPNQLIKFVLTAMLLVPVVAHAKSAPKEWYCKVSAFTNSYDAIGRTKAEAKLAASQKCTAENNPMHCEKISCEGPDASDTYNDDEESVSNRGWICKLTPFSERYMASASTRAKAKLKVIKMCEQTQNKMFCENPECEEG